MGALIRESTEAMHRYVGKAITKVRRTRNWSQTELAHEIKRHARAHSALQPTIEMISMWENGTRAPASEYRAALGRIAAGKKATEDLALLFLASITTWRVVAQVESLRREEQQ